jgi:hypothetical protein
MVYGAKLVPVFKLHIMDPNGKSSKGVVALTLCPSYPHKPTVIYGVD